MDVLGGHVSPHTASSSMVAILVMLMSRRKERDGIEIERERGQKESGGTSPKVSDYLLVGTWSLRVCVLTKSKNSHVPPVNSFVAAEG